MVKYQVYLNPFQFFRHSSQCFGNADGKKRTKRERTIGEKFQAQYNNLILIHNITYQPKGPFILNNILN